MKIRQSFVANSSSSSFIIGIKNLDEYNLPLWVKNIMNIFLKSLNSNNKISSIKKLNEYFKEEYLMDEDEIKKDPLYQKMKIAIENNIDVIVCKVDYNNEYMSVLLSKLPTEITDDTGIFLIEYLG